MKLSSDRVALMKVALDALSRPIANVDLARGVLREILEGIGAEPVGPIVNELGAVSIGEAARRLGYSSKHVRGLIKRGALGDAVIGSGRSTRIVVALALEALRDGVVAREPRDAVEHEYAAWKRRESMHVVNGGK